eukprot:1106006-Amphidinium_carterae.1
MEGLLPAIDVKQYEAEHTQQVKPPFMEELRDVDLQLLSGLLVQFFLRLASFKWDLCIVSVRVAGQLLRTRKPRYWQVHPMCVEDPFETHLNTCRNISPRGQRLIMSAILET